jgi:hypothetical protein
MDVEFLLEAKPIFGGALGAKLAVEFARYYKERCRTGVTL